MPPMLRLVAAAILCLAALAAPAGAQTIKLTPSGQFHKLVVFQLPKHPGASGVRGMLINGTQKRRISSRILARALNHAYRVGADSKLAIEMVRAKSKLTPLSRSSRRLRLVINYTLPVSSSTQCLTAGAPTLVKITSWRAEGSLPISDQEAAAQVYPEAERRAENTSANHYCPTDAELAAFHSAKDRYGLSESAPGTTFNTYRMYVDGRFTGTTEEIIQWAAHKWGIPEDWLRAQYAVESWWRQDAKGDRTTVSDPQAYPEFSRVAGTSDVFQSLGITQVRWAPDGSLNAGAEPLRWESTAFNADLQGATLRYYYDDPGGRRSGWGDSSYKPGDPWLSLGGWFQPYPWDNDGQRAYIKKVQNYLSQRIWEQADFQNG